MSWRLKIDVGLTVGISGKNFKINTLVADTQLYKRLCPSICWAVREHEWKSREMSEKKTGSMDQTLEVRHDNPGDNE